MRIPLDRGAFVNGPRFSASYWSDMAFPQLAEAVRKHYGMPDFAVTPPSLGAQVQATGSAQAAPSKVNRTDSELTQAVLEQIAKAGKGGVKLDIVVSTVNGRVTLAGTVKTLEQKKQILAEVERIAGAGNVEDQIQATKGDQVAL